MKIDRDILEKKLLIAINEIITSKDFSNKTLDNIKESLYQRNIFNATQLLNRNIPLSTVSIQVLYALTEAIYNETELYSVDPQKYFLDSEIAIYKTFKRDVSKENDIVEFEDMIQINESHWIGRISIQYLAKLYNDLRINYNPQTQRESGYIESKGGLIFVPKTYIKSVRDIKTAILEGTYEPDEITLNLLKDGEEDFEFKNGNIIIYEGRLDIIDGWHRSNSILKALAENPDIEMYFELRFTNFDIQKAKDFIIQKNKQRKINEKHIQSMNMSSYYNSITKALNENQKSDLRGKIVINRHLINRGYGLITFDVITSAIEVNFDLKTRSQSEKVQDYLIDFFNEVYNLFYDKFNNKNGIYTEPFSFIGYIAIASELYGMIEWKDVLANILNKIDFTEDNLFYQEVKEYQINISKPNIKKISKYFKEILKERVV